MATTIDSKVCPVCNLTNLILNGRENTRKICNNCATEYDKLLDEKLEKLTHEFERFKNKINEQKANSNSHPLLQEINKWKVDSIRKIEQTTEQCEQFFLEQINKNALEIENQLSRTFCRIQSIPKTNKNYGTAIDECHLFLAELKQEFDQISHFSLSYESTSFIDKIAIAGIKSNIPRYPKCFEELAFPESAKISINIPANAKWSPNGVTVAGGNGRGAGLHQLNCPHGIYVDDNLTVYIADYRNNRIVAWEKNATTGTVVTCGNGLNSMEDQIKMPVAVTVDRSNGDLFICNRENKQVIRLSPGRKALSEILFENIDCWGVAIDNEQMLYIADNGKHEVSRYRLEDKHGERVAGGNGRGGRNTQLNAPHFVCVDFEHSVYVSDWMNHRVVKWTTGAREGIVIAGDKGPGDGLSHLNGPEGIFVDQLGTLYVVDFFNHRVTRWQNGATIGNIIAGGNGEGTQENQLNRPIGLAFDQYGNLYVADQLNHRIQRFSIEK